MIGTGSVALSSFGSEIMRPSHCLTISSYLFLLVPLLMAAERAKPPEATKQAETEKVIRDLFKEAYAKKGARDKVTLAAELLEQGLDTKDDSTSRFVLIREAATLAAEGGDIALALRAVDQLTKEYDVAPAGFKAIVFERVEFKSLPLDAQKLLVAAAIEGIEEAIQTDDFESAPRLVTVARTAATTTKTVALVSLADGWGREVEQLKKDFEKVKPALATLAKQPKDVEANQIVGQYRCFAQGDWEKGLPFLLRGNDAKVKTLAEKDTATPKAAADKVALAEGWWELAEKQDAPAKWHVQRRAYHWYKSAIPDLAGLSKTKVEKRMGELEEIARSTSRQLEKGSSWTVLFRSADPSIWNKQVSKGSDYAIPLAKAPKEIKFLKMTNVPTGDFVIIEVTPKRMTELSDDGKYGWEGRHLMASGAYHLGVVDASRIIKNKGDIYISPGQGAMGWGFGIGHFVAGKQAYSWDGKPLEKTAFEIAVGVGPLSASESKKLLKKEKK